MCPNIALLVWGFIALLVLVFIATLPVVLEHLETMERIKK